MQKYCGGNFDYNEKYFIIKTNKYTIEIVIYNI